MNLLTSSQERSNLQRCIDCFNSTDRSTTKVSSDWRFFADISKVAGSGCDSPNVSAIASYNDNAPNNDDCWYIGSVTLSSVSGCNRQAVGDWIKSHHHIVDDHNNKYGLGQYYNKRHKGVEITDLINLWEKDQASNVSWAKVTPISKPEKITKLPATATTLDIIDYLGSHPNESVQIKGDGRALTYERVNDEKGYMKAARVLETGEEFPA